MKILCNLIIALNLVFGSGTLLAQEEQRSDLNTVRNRASIFGIENELRGKTLVAAKRLIAQLNPNAKVKVVPLSELARIEGAWSKGAKVKAQKDMKNEPIKGSDNIKNKSTPSDKTPGLRDSKGASQGREAGNQADSCSARQASYRLKSGLTSGYTGMRQHNLGLNLSSSNKGVEANSHFAFPSGGGSGKSSLVLLAVVGLVVVAALVVYAGVYIYKSAKSVAQCLAWYDVGVRWSYISDATKTQWRSGSMNGLYFSRSTFLPSGSIGLGFEIGHFDLSLGVTETEEITRYEGPYFLLGPNFEFPFFGSRKHFFQIDLLAGTTTASQIGVLTRLNMGYRLALSDLWSFSFNYGVGLIRVKEFEGLLSEYDDLNHIFGLQIGTRYF